MKDKKERRKWGLIVFIVLIMVGTTFSFVFYDSSPATEKVKYNGISFSGDGTKWIAKINGQYAAFTFLPNDVEKIPASGDFPAKLQGRFEVDSTYDLNSTYVQPIALAQHQMGLTLEAYNIYLRRGFTTNSTYNLPIIRCSNATSNVPVIYFRQGNSSNIRTENNCIIAEAPTANDFIRIKDRLLYGILGVLK